MLFGGVDIELTKEEAYWINPYIQEVNKVTGHSSPYIKKAGKYTLDGVQATAYARIRYTAGGDWKRTERQREVLSLAFDKIKTMNITKLNALADKILPQVSTNVNISQMLYLMTQASAYEIEETKGWPFEKADYQPAGVYYTVPKNLEKQVIELHEFLFDKEEYQVSTSLKAISDKMIKKTGIK